MDRFEAVFDDIFGHKKKSAEPETPTPETMPESMSAPTQDLHANNDLARTSIPVEPVADDIPAIPSVVPEPIAVPEATAQPAQAMSQSPVVSEMKSAGDDVIHETAEEIPTNELALKLPAAPVAMGLSAEDKEVLHKLSDDMKALSEFAEKISMEVREMHKLYHNEYSGRLRNVQSELDQYRERDKGRTYDGILGEIAKLYSENEMIVDQIEEPKTKKQLRYMFLDMLQILESYGVGKQKSAAGDKRNPRYCQVIERVPTDDPEKHDTVALSRNTGFYIENRPIVKERIDVYLYSAEKVAGIEMPTEEAVTEQTAEATEPES